MGEPGAQGFTLDQIDIHAERIAQFELKARIANQVNAFTKLHKYVKITVFPLLASHIRAENPHGTNRVATPQFRL